MYFLLIKLDCKVNGFEEAFYFRPVELDNRTIHLSFIIKKLPKKVIMKKLYFSFALLFFALLSCSDSETDGSSRLQVRLMDGPGDYEEVNIDIEGVSINYSNDDNDGWQELDMLQAGIYDLLELTNGVDVILADEELPSGTVNQIRLHLGENNTLIVDGQTVDLNTPSAQQSGLKLNINADLIDGITYVLLLDFDVEQSIVQAGNSGNYILKPTIRAIAEAESGAISGMVSPYDTQVMVFAHQGAGTDTLTTYVDDTSGGFLISGVPSGDYTLEIEPDSDSGYNSYSEDNVSVITGEITDVGEIFID